MGLPEVTDWVKDAPVRALRTVFAGIGQLLLVADRARAEEPDANPETAEQSIWRSLDSTGNVRLLPPGEIAETSQEAAAPLAATSLPLPRYDDLSLPSLRARLRSLDAAQLRVLISYEKSNAGRQDVIAMFERRIARLDGKT